MSPLKRLVLACLQDGQEWCAVTLAEEIGCSISGAGNAAMTLKHDGYLNISRSVTQRKGGSAKNFYVWTGKTGADDDEEDERALDEKARSRARQPNVYPVLWAVVTDMVRHGRAA